MGAAGTTKGSSRGVAGGESLSVLEAFRLSADVPLLSMRLVI
jgi:hypothetical protein